MCTLKAQKYLTTLHDLGIMQCFPTVSSGKLHKTLCTFKNGNSYITHIDKDGNFLHTHRITSKQSKMYSVKFIEKIKGVKCKK